MPSRVRARSEHRHLRMVLGGRAPDGIAGAAQPVWMGSAVRIRKRKNVGARRLDTSVTAGPGPALVSCSSNVPG